MANRVRLGSKAVVTPLYILSVGLVLADWPLELGECGRLGILVFLATLGMQLSAKIECKASGLNTKIDESVGAVWEAGGRAERRRMDVERDGGELAVVHSLVPRQ